MSLDLDGLPVDGVSRAGVATCLDLPSLGVAVDLGRCPASVVARRTVLFTHAHADHMGGIANHVSRRIVQRLAPARYVVPPAVAATVGELLDVWGRLDGHRVEAEVVPLAPGEELELRRDLLVRPFATEHRVPSQGYAFVRRRRKLLPELRGRDGKELARLRAEGAAIDEPVDDVELAIAGDTRFEAVLASQDARRARRLVVEVTFLDDAVPVERARAFGHTHLDELRSGLEVLRADWLVVTHVSPRYEASRARELVAGALAGSGFAGRVAVLV